jgi:hemolysin activation/secretion protein
MRRCTAAAAFVLAAPLVAVSNTAAAVEAAAPPKASIEAAAEPAFDVEAYDVDGNSLLDQLSIEKAVYPHLGPGRSRADVEGARRALEDAYHARGFDSVVVEVPAQTVADRVVRLHVVETSVGRLRVTGTRYYSIEDVKRHTPALAEGAVPNFREAQAEITELNRTAGRQVTPLVRPGLVPGTVDIDLKVTEQPPAHASIEITNDHSADTTPLRLTATMRYDNLWQLGHTASFSYAVAPQNRRDSEVYAGSYLAPAPNSRWSVLLYGYTSNSNVATIGEVAVLGKGYAAGVRGIAQLPALGPVTQSLSVGLDFKHFYQLIASGQSKTAPTASAIDYAPLNAVYSLQYDTATTSAHGSFGVTAGLRAGTREEAQFQISRSFAHANFIHANVDLGVTRHLPLDLAWDFRFSGQFANQSLLSGEQFSAGGLSSVRGYLQSAAVGDDGMFGSMELRGPQITIAPRRLVDDWRVFVFADAAQTWLIDPLVDQKREFEIYSTGLGSRFKLFEHVDGDLIVGFPLAGARMSEFSRAYTVFNLKAGF